MVVRGASDCIQNYPQGLLLDGYVLTVTARHDLLHKLRVQYDLLNLALLASSDVGESPQQLLLVNLISLEQHIEVVKDLHVQEHVHYSWII